MQFITDLESWSEIPIEPKTIGHHGGLVLVQTGEPESLLLARVKAGLTLTVAQTKSCLAWLKVDIKGQKSKSQLYTSLIECVLDSPEDRQEAFKKSSVGGDGFDEAGSDISEYDELLKLLEEDAENRDDQDLKNERKTVARKRTARAIAKGNEHLAGKKRGKGKGKGKGKAKTKKTVAKPKQKGKGKGRKKRKMLEDAQENAPAETPAISNEPVPGPSEPVENDAPIAEPFVAAGSSPAVSNSHDAAVSNSQQVADNEAPIAEPFVAADPSPAVSKSHDAAVSNSQQVADNEAPIAEPFVAADPSPAVSKSHDAAVSNSQQVADNEAPIAEPFVAADPSPAVSKSHDSQQVADNEAPIAEPFVAADPSPAVSKSHDAAVSNSQQVADNEAPIAEPFVAAGSSPAVSKSHDAAVSNSQQVADNEAPIAEPFVAADSSPAVSKSHDAAVSNSQQVADNEAPIAEPFVAAGSSPAVSKSHDAAVPNAHDAAPTETTVEDNVSHDAAGTRPAVPEPNHAVHPDTDTQQVEAHASCVAAGSSPAVSGSHDELVEGIVPTIDAVAPSDAEPRVRGPRLYSTPQIMQSLSPPGCAIRLNRDLALIILKNGISSCVSPNVAQSYVRYFCFGGGGIVQMNSTNDSMMVLVFVLQLGFVHLHSLLNGSCFATFPI